MSKTIIGNIDYIQGHIRYGHFELELTDKEYDEFQTLDEDAKIEWVRDGELIIDDYRINDYGDITIEE